MPWTTALSLYCNICNVFVCTNHEAIQCCVCKYWFQATCVQCNNPRQHHLDSDQWFCSSCLNKARPFMCITDEDLRQLLCQKHTNGNFVDMHKFCLYDKQRFKNVILGINNMENVQSSFYSVDDLN